MVKEREREFRDFNKLEKEGQRVFEKNMKSRPNRHGVIREIRSIHANSSVGAQMRNGKLLSIKNEPEQAQN